MHMGQQFFNSLISEETGKIENNKKQNPKQFKGNPKDRHTYNQLGKLN